MNADRPDRDARFNTFEFDSIDSDDAPVVLMHYPYGSARARQMVARKVRTWRRAAREGRACRVERHRPRHDLPPVFIVDWDGRVESVRVTTFEYPHQTPPDVMP